MGEQKRKLQNQQAIAAAGVLPDGSYKLRPSWQLFLASVRLWRSNLATAMFFFLLPNSILIAGQFMASGTINPRNINSFTAESYWGIGLITASLLWQLFNLPAGLLYMPLRAARGEHPGIIESYKRALPRVPRLLGSILLVGLVVVLGLACLIYPGVKAIRRYFFTPFYILEKGYAIREAMDASAADSKPAAKAIWGTISIAGLSTAAAFGLGQVFPPYGSAFGLLAGSLFNFGYALRYRDIRNARAMATRQARGKK